MTGQNPEDNTCPACGIAVFPAEAQVAANRQWHKRCYKCFDCKHLLSASTCHVLQGKLYCKHCLIEATRSASPHLYVDTTRIRPDQSEQGCPRCGGAVYKAEEVVEKGLTYHKKCFTCIKCNRPQDDKLQVFVGFDKEVYCKTCYPKIWHTPLPLDPHSTSKIKPQHSDDVGCKRCGGAVFEAERMGNFHRRCFTCQVCKKLLDPSTATQHRGEVFCRTCYVDHFDFRSKSVGPGDTSVIREANAQLNCPRCGGAVFDAEKVVSRKHFFHRKCLSCKACRRQLDPSSFFDATDGEVYCRACYSDRFGNSARARSVGPIDTGRIQAPSGDSSRCPRCSGRVFEAEKMVAKSGWFHRTCFRCFLCSHLLDKTNFSDGPNGGIYCRTCFKQIYEMIMQNPVFPKSTVETATIMAGSRSGEGCRRCRGIVFDAEKMAMRSGVYHKLCFNCVACRRSLDYLLAVDSPDGNDVFCHSCYQKFYGPTELRVGQSDEENARKRSDTSIIKPMDPNQGCPKCKGAVYHAEMVLAKGRAYHKSCATCHTCSARLDSLSLNTGPDGNIYCKQCSDNHFGSHYGCPYSTVDVKSVKAIDNDQDKCVHCEGKVYEKERITSPRKGLLFHKECFVCHFCKKKLDGTNSHTSQVYPFEVTIEHATRLCCKRCYSEKFETELGRNKFMDYSAIKSIKSSNSDPDSCRKCQGKVFEAEKVVTRSGLLHLSCLICFDCNRQLGPSSFCEASDAKVYCEGCYAVKYGHRARSKSVGPIDYTKIAGDDPGSKCVGCRGKIFDAEKMVTRFGPFHKPCFRCSSCKTSLDTAPDSARNRRGQICCKQCDEREKSIARELGNPEESLQVSKSFVNSTAIVADKNDPDRCPRCSGKVFPAEMFSMRSGKFHRKCFTCCDCKRMLDYTIACDGPNSEIFCKGCYNKYFAVHVIYSQMEDNTSKTELIKPVNQSDGCPRCSGAVFEAEKLQANGRSFHKRCATCKSCNIKLDASSLCSAGDGEIYCQGCHSRKFGGAGYRGMLGGQWIDEKATESMRSTSYVDPSKLRAENDLESSCKKCQGKVFDLEKISSNKNGVWHKQCFNCNSCRTPLTSTLAYGYEAPDNQVYCKACYVKSFGEGSTKTTYSDTKVILPGKGERGCNRCQGVVFDLEKVIAGGNWYHQNCFYCLTCKGKLDQLRAVVGKNGDVYCTTCYKGQLEEESKPSFSIVTIPAEPGDPTACPRCKGKVFEAEKMMTRSKWYHRHCFTCRQCSHILDYSSIMEGPNGDIYCKTCYVREYFTGGRNKFCDPVQPVLDGTADEACRKCKSKVFEMDKVMASFGVYHKLCLECITCTRKLDSTNFNDARDGSIYCRQCYDIKYGVFGRATSVGRPVQTSTGSSDRCPKCGANVFEAEKIVTSVGAFHPTCMRCFQCSRQLDVLSCFARMDTNIYCKNCYSEEFRVSSRRRSKSRATSIEREGQVNQTDDVVDAVAKALIGTTSILAEEGDPNKCPRCKGKVFEAEKMQSNRGIFHKKCFRCLDCQRTLDPSLVFDGFQVGHIFCKKCYLERYGPSVRNEEDQRERKPTTLAGENQMACPRCSMPVFANEVLYSNGRSYHKSCAKCRTCSRQLDFNSVYDGKDKDIYCRGCYGKKFGLHGYGYGGFGSIPALTAGGEEVRMEYHFTQFF